MCVRRTQNIDDYQEQKPSDLLITTPYMLTLNETIRERTGRNVDFSDDYLDFRNQQLVNDEIPMRTQDYFVARNSYLTSQASLNNVESEQFCDVAANSSSSRNRNNVTNLQNRRNSGTSSSFRRNNPNLNSNVNNPVARSNAARNFNSQVARSNAANNISNSANDTSGIANANADIRAYRNNRSLNQIFRGGEMPGGTETQIFKHRRRRKNTMVVSLLLTIVVMVLAFKMFYDALITQSIIQGGIKTFNLRILFLPKEDMSNLIPTINLDLILLMLLLSFINVIALIICISSSKPSKFILFTNFLILVSLIGIGVMAILFKNEATLTISKVFSAIFLGKKEVLQGVTGLEMTLIYFLSIAIILNLVLSCFYCTKVKNTSVSFRGGENYTRITSGGNRSITSRVINGRHYTQVRYF